MRNEMLKRVLLSLTGSLLLGGLVLSCAYAGSIPPFTIRQKQIFVGAAQSVPPVVGAAVSEWTPHPTVAITFDDGPDPSTTPLLLDILQRKEVPATFFVIGRNGDKHPDILRRMLAEGHVLGNHTQNHPNMTKLSSARLRREIEQVNALIESVGGRPDLLRPPYGSSNRTVRRCIEEYGMRMVGWTVDPEDWKVRNSQRIVQRAMEQVRGGGIILLHDIYPTTVAAVDTLIDELRGCGYEIVPLEELKGHAGA